LLPALPALRSPGTPAVFPLQVAYSTALILKSRRLEGILHTIPIPEWTVPQAESTASGARLLCLHPVIRLSSTGGARKRAFRL